MENNTERIILMEIYNKCNLVELIKLSMEASFRARNVLNIPENMSPILNLIEHFTYFSWCGLTPFFIFYWIRMQDFLWYIHFCFLVSSIFFQICKYCLFFLLQYRKQHVYYYSMLNSLSFWLMIGEKWGFGIFSQEKILLLSFRFQNFREFSLHY